MADRLVLRIYNAQQGHGAIQQAWAHAKGWLLADVLGVDDRHWKLEIDRSDEIGGFVRVEVTA